jgi:hypothetical protein
VSGRWLLEALSSSYARAEDPAAAESLLGGLLQLARLAGLLGLDGLCEQAVGALALAAGVFNPAPPGTVAERQQLAALHALLSLPAGPEAGLLGSSWVIVLRSLSALEALCQELSRPLPPAALAPAKDAAPAGGTFARMFGGLFGSSAGLPPPAAGAQAQQQAQPPQLQLQPHHQQHQQQARGALSPSSPPPQWEPGARDSLDGGAGGAGALATPTPAPELRTEPGVGLAAWALSPEGRAMVSRVYRRSASLDGEAVVVFMRALCAVSQEELESGSAPRLHSLQRVVGAAFDSMGRIRLVWAKLWAVVGAQLVGASCHPHRAVALYAVDALRQLVARLLARAELANFTHQARRGGRYMAGLGEEGAGGAAARPGRAPGARRLQGAERPRLRAGCFVRASSTRQPAPAPERPPLARAAAPQEDALRPFVAVLRQCDEPAVRELAVHCVMQAVASHPRGLGSGWRMATQALRLGAADSAPAVMAQAQEALQARSRRAFGGRARGGGGRVAGRLRTNSWLGVGHLGAFQGRGRAFRQIQST